VSVHPTRECVRRAVERGGFARALCAKLTMDADSLCELAAGQYARRLDGLLLSALRRGALAVGTDPVRRLLAQGAPPLLLVAEDAAGRREEIAEHAARLGGRCAVYGFKEELGRLLGRAEVGVLAVLETGLAMEVATTAARATELAARGKAPGSVTPLRAAPGRVSEAE
jgi:ribosomal protein L30E